MKRENLYVIIMTIKFVKIKTDFFKRLKTERKNAMDLKIKDKVFVVNGATGGIGRAVFCALKNEVAKMAISSRCPEKIKALAAELELGPDRLWTTTCDVTD